MIDAFILCVILWAVFFVLMVTEDCRSRLIVPRDDSGGGGGGSRVHAYEHRVELGGGDGGEGGGDGGGGLGENGDGCGVGGGSDSSSAVMVATAENSI